MENKKISSKILGSLLLLALACLMPMTMMAQQTHWTPVSAPYEDNMTLTGVIQINGTEQATTTLEVGAFCGTECRGAVRAVLFPATQRYVVMLTIFGNDGDQITFKLYDHNQGTELNYQSPAAVTFGPNGLGSLMDPYVLNFTSPSYTISASASPSAGGTVSGGGTYNYGSTCNLTAAPATGYTFVRWTKNGSQVSTNASYSFTVTENASYVAVFSLNSYTISASASPSAGGTVSGAGSYNYGTTCNLTATPATGYTFVRWTKNGTQVSTNASYSFTVTENASYVAVFSLNSYTISASASPSEGGTVSGGGTYNYGSTCNLTATPATGYTFIRWTKNGTQVSTNASYSFTVTENASYVAVFSLNSYTISASASPSAGGMVSGTGSYQQGSTCTVSATANAGYTFDNWTENGTVVSAAASYTFEVTANRTLVANFADATGTGKLSGVFSVGEHAHIQFSQGNLQYQASTNTWRFATNQYDCIGSANSNISQSYSGWIDLFGWGTSGYNHGAVCYQPWNTSSIESDYYAYGQSTYNLYDQTGQADWGYNAIINGGNTENNGWRTLTGGSGGEWDYVFNTRTTPSGIRYAMARVNGVRGVILLPDDWSASYYELSSTNAEASCSTNDITAQQWSTLEQHGAVFLPAAGSRGGTSVIDVGSGGCYWSASYGDRYSAHFVYILDGGLGTANWGIRYTGRSVRLVCPAENYSFGINASPNPAEGGAVSGGGTYQEGATCTLTATPAAGYTFTNWTENGEVVSTEATYSFTVIEDRELVANFALQSYTISASASPSEGGAVSGGGTYNYGSSCILTATPAEGYTFINWTENGQQVSTNASYTFTVNSNRTLVAQFQLQCFSISASANPSDGGTVSGAGSYNYGTTCNLTATPATGYTFVNWTEDGEVVSTEATYSFTVIEDRELVANFALQSYTISASASPSAGGTVSGAGSYNYGTTCTVSATANTGYTFENWTENGTVVSTAATYTFEVTTNRTLVANFTDATGTGKLSGVFSVGEHAHIQFSQGNLQYQASTNTWRFAINQYDCIGSANSNISQSYSGWIDLFGWGTSGYNHGANAYQPWSTSTSSSDYYAYGNSGYNLYDQTGQADWGYNAISNGGNTTNTWRTLTGGSGGEWDYVFNTRSTTSGIRYAKAQVNGVNGVILLPDDWSASYYSLSNTNQGGASYTGNVISASQWNTLEEHGAVFLPAAGGRYGTSVNSVGSDGRYWSASYNYSDYAYDLQFYDSYLDPAYRYYRDLGQSVRLVRPAENYSFGINASPNPAEGGAVSGGGTYQEGATCTLTATPADGYTFVNWTENGEVVSTEATYSFTVVEDRTLVANFQIQEDIIVFADPNVKAICVANWDTNGSGELSYAEAAAVTSLGEVFRGDTTITSFEELQYFTGLSAISANAFRNCSNLTGTLYIPNTVTSIGERAFMNCSGFTGSLTIPNSVTSIEDGAFNGCSGFTGSLIIPNSVISLGSGAFGNCTGFTGSLIFSNSVTTIGDNAFYCCRGFSGSLIIPNSVTIIEHAAFFGCSGFTGSLTIPNSVTSIGSYAFGYCRGFTGMLTIPSTVTSIGYSAFESCSGFTGLTIPNSVTSIDYKAFNNCTGITSMSVMPEIPPTLGSNVFGGISIQIPVNVPCNSIERYQSTEQWNAFTNYYGTDCPSYLISCTANPSEGGTVSGAGTYEKHTTCTLTATPAAGFFFVNWTENGEVVSTEATYSFMVIEDRDLVANFSDSYLSSLSDDFNDGVINTEFWLATGNNVYEEDGLLKMDQNVTDQNVSLLSRPMVVGTDNKIVLERRFMVHKSNNYAYPGFAIEFNGETGIHGRPLNAASWDGTTANTSGANYIGVVYGHTAYEGKYGIYVEEGIGNEIQGTRMCDAIFDTWLAETVVVDLSAGTFTYYLNDNYVATVEMPELSTLDVEYYTTIFSPWGWYTGHQQYMDHINIYLSREYVVTASADPSEGGTVSGGGNFNLGENYTMSASANEGYTFMYWTENGQQVSTDANYSFTVLRNRDLVAHFSLPLAISAAPDPIESGMVSGMGEYEYNTTCTMTATPNEGYTFMYWTENGNQVSASASYSFTVTTDRELVAHFMIKPVITVAINPAEGGTVSGMGEFDYNTTCTLIATPNPGYLFLNWSRNGSVVSSNATYSFAVTEDVDLEAVFSELNGLNIGEGEATNVYLPSYSYYNYTLSQQIYTPEEIGGSNSINSIAFFNAGGTKTRNYDVYLVHTDKTSFESNTDWITVSETDRVFSGDLTFTTGQWTTINLDTPFAYDGTSNLAIIVDDNSGNWTHSPHMTCRVFNANGNQAIRVYSDNTNYDPYNPSSYGGTLHNVKNQVIFGMSHYTITAAASDAGMGTVAGGGQYDNGSTCTLTATATGENFFTSWTENGVIVSTEPTYTFTVTRNRNIVANFSTNQWVPVGGNQYNMTVTGIITINGVEQTSTLLEVGAFCGEQCRASEFAQYFVPTQQYVVTLTIRSQSVSGENITFRLYDHLQGRELDEYQCINTVTFENDATIGSIGNWYQFAFNSLVDVNATVNPDGAGAITGTGTYPIGTNVTLVAEANEGFAFRDWSVNGEVVSTASEYTFVVTDAVQLDANFNHVHTQDLVAGWNWWSTWIETSGSQGLEMLENTLGSNGLFIKSQGQSVQNYYSQTGYDYWFGALQGLDIAKGYKISVSETAPISMVGMMADPSAHPVTIAPEWNWIGYPVSTSQNLSTALTGFTPEANDMFKSQGKTSVYYEDYGWFPDMVLQPGNSYLYKSNAGESKTLTYTIGRAVNNDGTQEHHWQPITGNQYNMTVTGVIVIDGVEQQSTTLEVGAFCGDECRGSEFAMYFPLTQQYIVTLTVLSNNASGENITFRLYDHDTGTEPYGVSPNTITFETDAIVGSMNNWYPFTFVSSQTISTDLAQGWTWFAPTVQTSIEAIQTALGGAYVQILAKNGTPSGDIIPGEMYRIQTNAPCTLAVTGAPITTATIAINRGENWFGYVGTEKTVTAAFEGFTPAEGDKVVSQNDGFAIYENGVWVGTLDTLQPGKGYVYVSKDAGTKTLTL